ncbi:hypothetical protein GPJ56_008597 [Histomonas meleagridis]|uniref:uncharacterized protein n=1 Tax=Histomonas meleagridis TaxID=135588 RepID=UPI00355A5CB0|nr:hypothetical protein GPJ56_008597 [Histomonas meleagridis]KAH0805826.1 hypothetical protein GO595_001465 [Histomonas meleagridis]
MKVTQNSSINKSKNNTLSSPKSPTKPNRTTEPVFLDSKKRIYDKLYRPVKAKTGKQEELEISPQTFPLPENVTTKSNYYSECREWKQQTKKLVSGFYLATPIVADLRIPQKPYHVKVGSHQYRGFNPRKMPPTPINYVVMDKIIFSGYDFRDEDTFPVQYPNRDVLNFKHQVTKEPQWQSQLLPREPYPFLYDKFQDFEEAYKNWRNVCAEGLKIPLRPKALDIKVDLIPNSPIYKMQAKPKEKLETHDFSWAKGLAFSGTEEEASSLKKLSNYPSGYRMTSVPDNCIVVGFDQTEFLLDFKYYGCHMRAIYSDTPLVCSKTVPLDDRAEKRILEVFAKHEHSGMNQILDLLNVGFDQESFQIAANQANRIRSRSVKRKSSSHLSSRSNSVFGQIPRSTSSSSKLGQSLLQNSTSPLAVDVLEDQPMSVPKKIEDSPPENVKAVSDGSDEHSSLRSSITKRRRQHPIYSTIMEFLQHYLTVKKLFVALSLIKLSPLQFARFSIILPHLMTPNFSLDLFNYIKTPENLDSLYSLTEQLLVLPEPRITLIKPSNASNFDISLSQLYLFSTILEFQKDLMDTLFFDLIMQYCRELDSNVVKQIPERRNKLWKSLESNTKSTNSRLMGMIAEIKTRSLICSLIGKDFFKRANIISNYDLGRRFLLRFIYNGKGSVISSIILSSNIYIDNNFTQFMNMFCSLLLQILAGHLNECKLCLNGFLLLPIFDHADLSNFSNMFQQAAKLLCNPSLISNFSAANYQNKLTTIAQKITDSRAPQIQVLSALLPFSKVEGCNLTIIENINFMNKLISNLDKSSNKEFFMSWKLMNSMVDFLQCGMKLFSYEQIQKLFLTLANSDDPAVIRQFMHFLIRLWGCNSAALRAKVVQATLPAVGSIACLIKLAPAKFEKYQKTQDLIMQFYDMCLATQNTEQIEFKKQLNTHMDSNTKQDKKGKSKQK